MVNFDELKKGDVVFDFKGMTINDVSVDIPTINIDIRKYMFVSKNDLEEGMYIFVQCNRGVSLTNVLMINEKRKEYFFYNEKDILNHVYEIAKRGINRIMTYYDLNINTSGDKNGKV